MQTLNLALEAAAHSDPGLGPYFVGAIGAVAFIALGLVTWAYRDVANRSPRRGAPEPGPDHH